MRAANEEAIFDAMAELCHLENKANRDEALISAVSQMIGAVSFVEAHAGKAKADQVVGALYRAQLSDRIVSVCELGSAG